MPMQQKWKGREVDYSYPYPRVYWPEHPMAQTNGMLKIHRAVLAEYLGRNLAPDETPPRGIGKNCEQPKFSLMTR